MSEEEPKGNGHGDEYDTFADEGLDEDAAADYRGKNIENNPFKNEDEKAGLAEEHPTIVEDTGNGGSEPKE